jgi:ubiquinone/menaquinone biosynthesis C-methylase UbiE
MYHRVFYQFYKRAAKIMCLDCQEFIKKGDKILDVGCGSAIAGKEFQKFFQAEIVGVDIKDRRVCQIPFRIINGKDLPFPENSFDVVLIAYVLHHAKDAISLLREAKRVSRGKVIIFEDLAEDFLSKLISKLHGLSYQIFHSQKNISSFKSEKEWEKFFQEIGLDIVFKKRIQNLPPKKELFILDI